MRFRTLEGSVMFCKSTISRFDRKEFGYEKNGRVRKIGENLGTTNFENAGIAKMNFEIHFHLIQRNETDENVKHTSA